MLRAFIELWHRLPFVGRLDAGGNSMILIFFIFFILFYFLLSFVHNKKQNVLFNSLVLTLLCFAIYFLTYAFVVPNTSVPIYTRSY